MIMRFIKLCVIIITSIITLWIFSFIADIYLKNPNLNFDITLDFFSYLSKIIVYLYSFLSAFIMLKPQRFKQKKSIFINIILGFIYFCIFRIFYFAILLATMQRELMD